MPKRSGGPGRYKNLIHLDLVHNLCPHQCQLDHQLKDLHQECLGLREDHLAL